jgi:predicted nucleic acid-binding protein
MAAAILMRIVIDTGVLFHPETLRSLARRREAAVLPAVAYAERVRQLRQQGRSLQEFNQFLSKFKVIVEPFGPVEAERYASRLPEEDWQDLIRDAFIAGHVEDGDQLWTTNPADFRRVGVPAERIVAVPLRS